jgi:hypothetical protein
VRFLLTWFRALSRARELPEDGTTPVRVSFVGRVISPNHATSPITGFTASLLEIALVDWETLSVRRQGLLQDRELDRFTTLGAARFGNPLVVEDARGRSLTIENEDAPRVVPLSERPLVLDVPAPKELAPVAERSRHLLSYREVRFRSGDSVRVVATVHFVEVMTPGMGGYRGSVLRTLRPVAGERLELHEMIGDSLPLERHAIL